MAIGYVDDSKLTAVADAIRAKKGSTDLMTLDQMPTEIEGIGGGSTEEKNANFDLENWTSDSVFNYCNYIKITKSSAKKLKKLNNAFKRTPANVPMVIEGLNNLDVSEVTDMSFCFYGSGSGEVDLSNWVGENVYLVTAMFEYSNFTKINLKNFRAPDITNISDMFQHSDVTDVDISSLVTDNVTIVKDILNHSMFSYTDIVNVKWPSNFIPNSAVTELWCNYSTISHESVIDLLNKLADRTASPAKLALYDDIINELTDDEKKIATDKGWTIF